jgi:pilus assembly protein CpaF
LDAAAAVETEVRNRVRVRGIDPLTDPMSVRLVVDEVLADYAQFSVTGHDPITNGFDVAQGVVDAVAGLGPLQQYLDDPEVEEIWINEPGRVFVARRGNSELTPTLLADDQVRDLVERMLKPSNRRVDLSSPFVDATLPDGSRVHVVIPDITREHWAVNIRKFVVRAERLDQLVELGTLPHPAARFLDAAVTAGLNIIVSGGTQAGKTTLLNCLAAAIPANERVVTVEEVFELRVPLPDVVSMQTRQPSLEGTGEIRLRRLVKEALRMRPSRIIVGEIRQEECLDLLIALNSGLPGMCSVHANSAREAVTKLCTLPLLAGENVGHGFVVPTVAASVDLVVHAMTDSRGRRRVREIVAIPGRTERDVVEVEPIFHWRSGQLQRASGFPPHLDRFEDRGIDVASLLDGAAI